jgi:hypothetical protein
MTELNNLHWGITFDSARLEDGWELFNASITVAAPGVDPVKTGASPYGVLIGRIEEGYVSNCVQKLWEGFLEKWSWCRL